MAQALELMIFTTIGVIAFVILTMSGLFIVGWALHKDRKERELEAAPSYNSLEGGSREVSDG